MCRVDVVRERPFRRRELLLFPPAAGCGTRVNLTVVRPCGSYFLAPIRDVDLRVCIALPAVKPRASAASGTSTVEACSAERLDRDERGASAPMRIESLARLGARPGTVFNLRRRAPFDSSYTTIAP